MGLFDGLYIFVQVKDRPSRDVGRDIRTIQVRVPPSSLDGIAQEDMADNDSSMVGQRLSMPTIQESRTA